MRQSRTVGGYGRGAVFDRYGCDEEEVLCRVKVVVACVYEVGRYVIRVIRGSVV